MDVPFTLDVDRAGLEAVVQLSGEIDMSNARRVRDCLLGLGDEVVIVDCRHVTFMETSALSAFIAAQKQIRQRGGTFVLYGVRAPQLRILELSGLTDFFDSLVPD